MKHVFITFRKSSLVILQAKSRAYVLTLIRNCLEGVLKTYQSGSDRKFRNGEIARSSLKLAEVLKQLGDYQEADKHLAKAIELYRSIVDDVCKLDANEEDYDKLVNLWAR